MEEDKIVLDRKSFEALAVDSRVKILKSLKERRKTLSEIAKEQGMSVSGVKEHLETLEGVGLIEKKDDGHKWKYYELTKKGGNIVAPRELRVWILLSMSFIALMASMTAIIDVPGFPGGTAYSSAPQDVPAPTGDEDLMFRTAAALPLDASGGATADATGSAEGGADGSGGSGSGTGDATGSAASEPVVGGALDGADNGGIANYGTDTDAVPKLMVGEGSAQADSGLDESAGEQAASQNQGFDLTIPFAVAAISALSLAGCIAILARNRMKVTSL
jgi:DNA-binding transcriptional ArsR family regulator